VAKITVTEAGYYNGQFIAAGGSYDDGVEATEKVEAKPAKKAKAKAKSADDAEA
jgi:hypothetical protein